jgi:flagellar hook assembly protein FlgD
LNLDEKQNNITARIFNLSGRLKRVIQPEVSNNISGNQVLVWDGKDFDGKVVKSGLYIVTLEKESTILKTTVGVLNR